MTPLYIDDVDPNAGEVASRRSDGGLRTAASTRVHWTARSDRDWARSDPPNQTAGPPRRPAHQKAPATLRRRLRGLNGGLGGIARYSLRRQAVSRAKVRTAAPAERRCGACGDPLFFQQLVALLDQPVELFLLWAIRSALRSSSSAPDNAAACSMSCRMLSRAMAMRCSSSASEGGGPLVIEFLRSWAGCGNSSPDWATGNPTARHLFRQSRKNPCFFCPPLRKPEGPRHWEYWSFAGSCSMPSPS
jgi:hypothetical protein